MVQKLVSYETVAVAAEGLKERDERISIRSIMKELGGGSPNQVLQFLQEWRSGRPVVRRADISVNERITDAIVEQLQEAMEEAAKASDDARNAAEEDMEVLKESQKELEALNADLQAQLDNETEAKAEAIEKSERLLEQSKELKEELKAERETTKTLEADKGKAEVLLHQAEGILADTKEREVILVAKVENLSAENSELGKRFAVAQSKNEGLIEMVGQLRSEIADLKETVKAEKELHGKTHMELETERGSTQAAEKATTALEKELLTATHTIKSLQIETEKLTSQLKTALENLDIEVKKGAGFEQKAATLESEKATLINSEKALKTELDKLKAPKTKPQSAKSIK